MNLHTSNHYYFIIPFLQRSIRWKVAQLPLSSERGALAPFKKCRE